VDASVALKWFFRAREGETQMGRALPRTPEIAITL
jgi:hypothetical protein